MLSTGLPVSAKDGYTPIPRHLSLIKIDGNLFEAHLPATAGHAGADLVVAQINPEDEVAAAKKMAHNSDTIFVTAKTGDPVNSVLDPNRDAIVSSDHPAKDIAQSVGPQRRPHRPLLPGSLAHPNETKQEYRKRVRTALLIAIFPGAAQGGAYFFVSSSYVALAGDFGIGYLLGASLLIYSQKWLHFSESIGAILASSKLGKTVSPRWQERFQRAGQVLAAYGLNIVAASGLMGVGGTLRDAADMGAIFVNALTMSDEMVDYKLESMFGKEKAGSIAMPLRVFVCSFVMMLALAGVHEARLAMEIGVPTIALTHIFKDRIDPPLVRGLHKVRKVWGFTKKAISLRWKKKTNCEGELTEPQKVLAQEKDAG